MALQINPSKFPIWLGETELKLGLSQDAQVVRDVTNSQERLIEMLFEGVARDQVRLLGASVSMSESETAAFIEKLRPSLLAESSIKGESNSNDLRFAEIVRLGLETNQPPGEVLGVRRRQTIAIKELGRTGLNLLRVLTELGFRDFKTSDYGVVEKKDLGELGYPKHLLGVSRLSAARELLAHDNTAGVLSQVYAHDASWISVMTATHRLFPHEYQNCDRLLAIEYGLNSVLVTGVLLTGINPCLGCRDRWSSESDPNWTGETIQLKARHDELDDGISLLAASALAAKSICDFVDHGSSGQATEVDVLTRLAKTVSFQFHPACNCQTSGIGD